MNLLVFLELQWEAWGSSLVVMGDLRERLMLPQGSKASFQVARGTSGFLSSSGWELALFPRVPRVSQETP